MKLDFLLFLTGSLPIYMIALIIGGAVILVALIVFLIIFFSKKNKKTKVDNSVWLLALGGQENVNEITAIGSRINLSLKDKEAIDRDKLKELGVKSILVMSNKVTLVVESQAEMIANSIRNSLNN